MSDSTLDQLSSYPLYVDMKDIHLCPTFSSPNNITVTIDKDEYDNLLKDSNELKEIKELVETIPAVKHHYDELLAVIKLTKDVK